MEQAHMGFPLDQGVGVGSCADRKIEGNEAVNKLVLKINCLILFLAIFKTSKSIVFDFSE